jgi:hypothetical protein
MHPLRGAPSHSLSHRAGGTTRRARGPDSGVFAEWLALSSLAIWLESLRTHRRETSCSVTDRVRAAAATRSRSATGSPRYTRTATHHYRPVSAFPAPRSGNSDDRRDPPPNHAASKMPATPYVLLDSVHHRARPCASSIRKCAPGERYLDPQCLRVGRGVSFIWTRHKPDPSVRTREWPRPHCDHMTTANDRWYRIRVYMAEITASLAATCTSRL